MKMKIISSLWILLFLLTFLARAQNISQFQYFYDTDPGVGVTGNGGFITVSSPADSVRFVNGISTAGLSPGMHTLFIRPQYTNGMFGLWASFQFVINPVRTPATISTAEYFFDNEP